jgi:hypothetical protein
MIDKFTYHEALLGLTTIVAWSDGENHKSQVDQRVNMILNEGITNTEIDVFKAKYEEIDGFDKIYKNCILALKKEDSEKQNKALAYMWQSANVSTSKEDDDIDLEYITDNWVNNKGYVELEELKWINMARKDLGVNLDDFKKEFAALPETKRI